MIFFFCIVLAGNSFFPCHGFKIKRGARAPDAEFLIPRKLNWEFLRWTFISSPLKKISEGLASVETVCIYWVTVC